ncbi:uncharacterized protein [Elaeis guineensis]
MLQRAQQDFYWHGMKSTVREYVVAYSVCQRNKVELLHPAVHHSEWSMEGIHLDFFLTSLDPLKLMLWIRLSRIVMRCCNSFGECLQQAQHRMKVQYDKGRQDLSFALGAWVWLRLQPYRQMSIAGLRRTKLTPRYFGPYQVLHLVGSVTYQLALPPNAKLHDIFHVSLLQPYHGDPPTSTPPLPSIVDRRVTPQLASILCAQLNCGHWEVLVLGQGYPETDATWESVSSFWAAYPSFELEDKLFVQAGSDVRVLGMHLWGKLISVELGRRP